MPLQKYLQEGVFDPEAVKAMTTAFDDALRTLKLVDRSDPIIEIVARKIVEVARLGERDPARLCELALKHLGR